MVKKKRKQKRLKHLKHLKKYVDAHACGSLDSFINKIISIRDKAIKGKFADIKVVGRVDIFGSRLETDKEFENRVVKIAREKEKQEERVKKLKEKEKEQEQKTLKRLASKHGFDLLPQDRCAV